MKFKVKFKTPDAIYWALREMSDEEREEHEVEMNKCAARFIEYGEYVTIEFDTAMDTARVVPL